MNEEPQKSKCEMKNIDFDKMDFIKDDAFNQCAIGRWYKNGILVKEVKIPYEKIIFKKFPICMACWKWRGEFVEMCFLRKNRNHEEVNQCPRCRGLFYGDVDCVCGEIPHRVKCPFGFEIYMSILKEIIS